MIGSRILFTNSDTKDFFKTEEGTHGIIRDRLSGPEGTRYLTEITEGKMATAKQLTIVRPEEIEILEA